MRIREQVSDSAPRAAVTPPLGDVVGAIVGEVAALAQRFQVRVGAVHRVRVVDVSDGQDHARAGEGVGLAVFGRAAAGPVVELAHGRAFAAAPGARQDAAADRRPLGRVPTAIERHDAGAPSRGPATAFGSGTRATPT